MVLVVVDELQSMLCFIVKQDRAFSLQSVINPMSLS